MILDEEGLHKACQVYNKSLTDPALINDATKRIVEAYVQHILDKNFETLYKHLIRMASSGTVGSLTEWDEFVKCIYQSIGMGENKNK